MHVDANRVAHLHVGYDQAVTTAHSLRAIYEIWFFINQRDKLTALTSRIFNCLNFIFQRYSQLE